MRWIEGEVDEEEDDESEEGKNFPLPLYSFGILDF